MSIFITGGYGLLGTHIRHMLSAWNYYFVAPTRQECDVVKGDTLKFLKNKNFDFVLNLAAYTNVGKAEEDGCHEALVTNTAVEWMFDVHRDTRIIHLSTDYVYNGYISLSKETDLPEPFNVYGRTKAMGDMKILAAGRPNVTIIRTSFKPVRWPYPAAFTDVMTNADTVDVMAKKILEFMLTWPPAGVYNIGTEPKTIYELAKRNNPDVQKTSVYNVSYLRPDVTMDLTKYQSYLRGLRAK